MPTDAIVESHEGTIMLRCGVEVSTEVRCIEARATIGARSERRI